MLSYFRINDPYRLIGLLVVQVLVFLPILIDPPPVTLPELKSLIIGRKFLDGFYPYTGVIDTTAPLTNFVFAFVQLIVGDSLGARHIIGALFIFAQAVFIGVIYIDKKVFQENSFIPSLVFGLLFILSFDTLAISGEMLGLFFMLLALNSIFKEIEFREESFEMVSRIGVFIGIATLFAFSYIVFVPGSLLILLMYTRSSGRKFLLLIIGFLIPHLFTISFYLIYDGAAALWQYYYLPNLRLERIPFVSLSDIAPFLIVPVAFLIASFVLVNRESRLTKYQSQVLQAMFFWTLFSIVQVFYAKELKPQTCIVLIPGFSFFIAHFLLIIRRKRLAEIAFWILLGGLLTGTYYTRYFRLDDPAYATLVARSSDTVSGKKLLILDRDIGSYVNNPMSTPFLNWNLSRAIFENPQYYDNVILVHDSFINDPPDVILDQEGLMEPFLERIPELRKRYSRTAQGYQRTVANSRVSN